MDDLTCPYTGDTVELDKLISCKTAVAAEWGEWPTNESWRHPSLWEHQEDDTLGELLYDLLFGMTVDELGEYRLVCTDEGRVLFSPNADTFSKTLVKFAPAHLALKNQRRKEAEREAAEAYAKRESLREKGRQWAMSQCAKAGLGKGERRLIGDLVKTDAVFTEDIEAFRSKVNRIIAVVIGER